MDLISLVEINSVSDNKRVGCIMRNDVALKLTQVNRSDGKQRE